MQQNGAPLKALTVNNNYFYTHIGDSICQWDLNTGNLISTAVVPGGVASSDFNSGKLIIENGGLAVDSCNNVYVGSQDRVLKFDENLNLLSQINVSFIVHDLSVNSNGEVIAVGSQFNNTQSNRNGQIEAINFNACPQFKIGPCLVIGITKNENETSYFSISPNPFTSQLELNYSFYENKPTINVFNIIGKLILSKVISSYSTVIDLSKQSNGVYFVELSDGNHRINRKIIKQ